MEGERGEVQEDGVWVDVVDDVKVWLLFLKSRRTARFTCCHAKSVEASDVKGRHGRLCEN